jgi:hypothetical protein
MITNIIVYCTPIPSLILLAFAIRESWRNRGE